jgi:hypothetical protein
MLRLHSHMLEFPLMKVLLESLSLIGTLLFMGNNYIFWGKYGDTILISFSSCPPSDISRHDQSYIGESAHSIFAVRCNLCQSPTPEIAEYSTSVRR